MANKRQTQRDPESQKLTASLELFARSTQIIRDNVGVFFVLLVVPFLMLNATISFNIGYSVIRAADDSVTAVHVQPYFLGIIVLTGLYTLLALGPLTYAYIQAAKGVEPKLRETITKGLPFFWKLLGLSLLTSLLVLGGLVLLIIPGIIMLRRYYLAPYYLVDKNLSIMEAMRRSADESKQFSGSIYGLFGVNLLIGFLNIVPLVGTYLSSVMQLLYAPAPALRYQEIQEALKQN